MQHIKNIVFVGMILATSTTIIFSAEENYESTIDSIGFKTIKADGWESFTTFKSNLKVSGGHISSGDEKIVHLVEDQTTEEFYKVIKDLGNQVLKLKEIRIKNEKLGKLQIIITTNKNANSIYEVYPDEKFSNESVERLRKILILNERIYSFQEKGKWVYKSGD